jgi:hypothetical protein
VCAVVAEVRFEEVRHRRERDEPERDVDPPEAAVEASSRNGRPSRRSPSFSVRS